MSGPVGKNVAEDHFVERISPRAPSVVRERPSDGLKYPENPYHNESPRAFARRLSRMDRSARLVAKGIRKTLRAAKPKWEAVYPHSKKWAEWV